jgi:PAS domain S-box-containing protein
MNVDENEERLLRSVALQNAQAVLLARERAERELRESNERITNILESISDAFIVLDKEWRFTYVNPRAEEIFLPLGKSRANLLGKIYWLEFQDLVGTLLEENFRRAVAANVKVEFEIFYAPLNSWFHVRAYPGRNGLSVYFLDITVQKRANDEQRQLLQSLSEARDQLEKRVEDRTAELEAANESLRDLSARLLKVQDEERRRLARELHDSVGQILAALSMNIAVVQSQSHKLDSVGARAVSENAELLQQVSSEIRTMSHLLHPPLLEIAGLASALRWYVDGFSERSKIKVDIELPSGLDRLPNETELAVFRIVQECLTNIHRHSGSETAAIRIWQEDSGLVIQIRDHGKGISLEKQLELTGSSRGGVGLRGMRERLRQLGGAMEVQSEGKGTTIVAIFPLGPIGGSIDKTHAKPGPLPAPDETTFRV